MEQSRPNRRFTEFLGGKFRGDVSSPPDEDQVGEVPGSRIGDRFHVLASWRQEDGGVYVYAASTVSPSSAAAERWARDQMLIHHGSRGEPDVVSVMTYEEWEQTVLDIRRLIGE